MKKINRLTESDLSRIVKRVIYESVPYEMDLYLRRRGVNPLEFLEKVLSRMYVCQHATFKTYFNHVTEALFTQLYLTNEFLRKDLASETLNLQTKLRNYIIEEHFDFLLFYYNLKCKKNPKY